MELKQEPLTEKYAELLESEKYPTINESEKATMAQILEAGEREVEKLMSESTVSGDIAPFTPILIPMIRRVYPALIANDLLGLQPLNTPTGYIYSMGYRYTNDSNNPITPTVNAQILDVDAGDTVGDTITGGTSGATGVVRYVEGNKELVELTGTAQFVEGEALTGGTSTTANKTYSNEMLFHNILKNYTGPYTTAAGEQLSTDMKEIGLDIQRKSVEAVTRKLKAKYTMEMYQDLKAQHGILADEELMNLMSYEVQAEIDREVLGFVNANSTVLPDYYVWRDQTGGAGTANDGRWELEKYRLAGIKFSAEGREIGRLTRRGSGNVIIASSKVVSMFDQLSSFAAAPIGSSIVDNMNVSVAGTFDRKFKVILDNFATSEYATILYKGADRRDGMGYFSPYVPLSFQRTVLPESGQPAILAATRYALSLNPQNPEYYARTMGVDFTDSVLA